MDMRLIRLGRKILPRQAVSVLTKWLGLPERIAALERGQSLLAAYALRQSHPFDLHQPEINRHEAKVFSQNGEDGILLFLFSRIGTTNRRLIELGCGDGSECNSANLIVNWGWRGVLLDGDPGKAARCSRLYGLRLGSRASDAEVVQARITAENVDSVLSAHCQEREPDLVSIDIDGNDYWVWKALESLRPRLVIIEYNAVFGQRSVTVPYDPGFDRYSKHFSGLYFGASLHALAKLADEKGYDLVGCDSYGVNAFFVRKDVAAGRIDAVTPETAFRPLLHDGRMQKPDELFARVAHLELEEI